MCKTLYGLLSFPFIIFSIPSLAEILTKSNETGVLYYILFLNINIIYIYLLFYVLYILILIDKYNKI